MPPRKQASPRLSTKVRNRAQSWAGGNGGGNGAGLFLAVFGYPLAVNLITGGPAQMWGWVKAKWVNQPYGAPAGPKAATPAPFYPTPTGKAPTLPPSQALITRGG